MNSFLLNDTFFFSPFPALAQNPLIVFFFLFLFLSYLSCMNLDTSGLRSSSFLKNHLDVEVELDAKVIVDALTTNQHVDLPSWMIVSSWLPGSITFSSSTVTVNQTNALMGLLGKVPHKLMIFWSMITPLWS